MTTPADLAADAARRARRQARNQGILQDRYVEPPDTPSTHLIKLQQEAAAAQLERDAAVADGQVEEVEAGAADEQPAEEAKPKGRRRSSAKAS